MSDTNNTHFWSGRFDQPPHELFEQLNASIGFDWRLAPYDIQGSLAHARMLAKIGVIEEDEFLQIEKGLGQVTVEIARGDLAFELADEDIHSAIEKRLIGLIGDAGKKLHTARSRNDQVATDLALYIRDHIQQQATDLTYLLQAVLKQAENGREAVMPGYTHLQRAQPVLLAHHMLAYFQMFSRDFNRLMLAYEAAGVMPLGAGALAGVNYPVDREAVAAELGFDSPGANSLDDVSNRDFVLDYLAAATGLSLHLSRLSTELILWSTSEFGFVEIADAFTSGSSIMPQKKNADACELIRAKANRVVANYSGLANLLSALPLGYNKDMQEDKIYVFDTTDILMLTLPVAAEMMAGLSFNTDVMRKAATGGFTLATEVADYLVVKGIPFREAHRITGELVRLCLESGRTLEQLELDELQAASEAFDESYYAVVDIDAAIARKASAGGTAPASIKDQLSLAGSRMKEMGEALAALGQ